LCALQIFTLLLLLLIAHCTHSSNVPEGATDINSAADDCHRHKHKTVTTSCKLITTDKLYPPPAIF